MSAEAGTKDLYEVLEVPKGSDDAAIKKAYRKLALKHHPDKNPDNKEEAQKRFQEIGLAYEILGDPEKRKLYDKYGPAGVGLGGEEPQGPDMGGGGGMGGGFGGGFPGGGMPGGRPVRFNSMDPNIIFEHFFGTRSVDEASNMDFEGGGLPFMFMRGGGGGGGMGGGMGGMPGMAGMGGMGGGGGGGGQAPFGNARAGRQAPPVEYPLNVTLEDLYNGTTKKVRITKKSMSAPEAAGGGIGSVAVEKSVPIKPGWKDGTKITYEKEGDEAPGVVPADIVFVVRTKPHARFTRDENNLLYTADISLEEALSGPEVTLELLSGRKIKVKEPRLASSSAKTVVPGEGMPLQKDREQKGDLIISYNIQLPLLNEQQRQQVKQVIRG